MDLEMRVFGRITASQVIGSEPPIGELEAMLGAELERLGSKLADATAIEAAQMLQEQQKAAGMIQSRPGSMAISQEKIRAYCAYSEKYLGMLGRAAP